MYLTISVSFLFYAKNTYLYYFIYLFIYNKMGPTEQTGVETFSDINPIINY